MHFHLLVKLSCRALPHAEKQKGIKHSQDAKISLLGIRRDGKQKQYKQLVTKRINTDPSFYHKAQVAGIVSNIFIT